jgi:hypothetical protein
MIESWEWPQYLLAAWWASGFVFAVIVWGLTDVKVNRVKAFAHWFGVASLIVVLYFGGFWG